MKKIKFVQSIAGHAEPLYSLPDFSFRPGEEAEVNATLADAWIEAGIAQPFSDLVDPVEPPKKKK